MTQPTWIGAGLSVITFLFIAIVFGMEFNNYVAVDTTSSIISDYRSDAEILSIEFNISFPVLPCKFASVDMSDMLGIRSLNMTKTIQKFSIDPNLEFRSRDSGQDAKGMKHDDENNEEGSISLNPFSFDRVVHQHDILGVIFCATWAPSCIDPMASWERAGKIIRDKYNPEIDGRIRLAKFDCTSTIDFCKSHHIRAFPSYQFFQKGHYSESYIGDRGTDILVKYVESLVAEQKNRTTALSIGGCRIEGFVDVEQVPVYLIISSRSATHSFEASIRNVSHVISHISFGRRIPIEETSDDKRFLLNSGQRMIGRPFIIQPDPSDVIATIEHHIQIIKTETVRRDNLVEEYDYTAQSSLGQSHDFPRVKFLIQLPPVKVLVTENGKSVLHFFATILAFAFSILQVGYYLYLALNTRKVTSKKKK